MKVILLRDVAKIGKRYEVKEVPDGYALNKLIPKKDAEPATPANLKRVLERTRGTVRLESEAQSYAQAVMDACAVRPLQIMVEANEQGHLFQAVQTSAIVAALAERGFLIEQSQLSFDSPVKSIGNQTVLLKAAGKVFLLPLSVEKK